jgi:hypothetical protein
MASLLRFLPGTSSAADTTQYTLLPSMSSSLHKDVQDEEEPLEDSGVDDSNDPDAEFGGLEARKRLEKTLLLKLDLRMSILIVIYILNYVSTFRNVLHLAI